MDNLHWEILDEGRIKLLPSLIPFKETFYLAGGTALALLIGHRDSIDLDFFSAESFSTPQLFNKLNSIFPGRRLLKVQEEKDTLTVLADKIKISFFAYPYKLVNPLILSESINLAAIEDIGLMKFSAITGRAVFKDYVDLYWILRIIPLADLLILFNRKYENLDVTLVLKSLVYFDDVVEEPVNYKGINLVSFDTIKSFLRSEVESYLS